jgi:hypothetical protein
MRYTKREVQGMFERLAKSMNKTIGYKPNEWNLDYASIYGGYVIEECGENGSVSHPFSTIRRGKRDMYLSLLMAAQAVEEIRYNQELKSKFEQEYKEK